MTHKLSSDDICCEKNEEGKGSEAIIRNQVVRVDFTEKEILKQRPEGGQRGRHVRIWRRVFQTEELTSAKALGPECAWCVSGAARGLQVRGQLVSWAV